MDEIWVYEMNFDKKDMFVPEIDCVPLPPDMYEEYRLIYNACFAPMRRALGIEPYDFYGDISVIGEKALDIFIYAPDGVIIGSVACYGNEIDDLIVKESERNKGIGKKLLMWAIHHIREQNDSPVTLHAAEWNSTAVKLYENAGFVIRRRERVR